MLHERKHVAGPKRIVQAAIPHLRCVAVPRPARKFPALDLLTEIRVASYHRVFEDDLIDSQRAVAVLDCILPVEYPHLVIDDFRIVERERNVGFAHPGPVRVVSGKMARPVARVQNPIRMIDLLPVEIVAGLCETVFLRNEIPRG